MTEKPVKTNKMSRSKVKALPILATTPNYSEAARLIGCSYDQIYSWLRDPDFKNELEKLRSQLVDDAISKMKSHVTKAVDVLATLMDDESSQVRRAACNDILNHVGRFIELKELETRLVNLEKVTERL
jgi:HEAT repeat protein